MTRFETRRKKAPENKALEDTPGRAPDDAMEREWRWIARPFIPEDAAGCVSHELVMIWSSVSHKLVVSW